MRLNSLLLVAMCSTVALTACVPAGTYNPDDPNQRTRQGALIGATAGAVAGLATGDSATSRRDRALAGIVLGGLGGAITGNILDRQAAELQRDITTSGVRIINEGNQLRVVMPDGILFAVDSDRLNPAIMNDLFTVADNLNRYPDSLVRVIGHTDSTGSAAHNVTLSQRRAGSVASVLRQGGVSAGRLVTIGAGEDQPIASNLTPEGRAQNRRVEILIIPTN